MLEYEHVFFVNSSVCGPFLPPVVGADWKTTFLEKLEGDVGLVGSTINILTQCKPWFMQCLVTCSRYCESSAFIPLPKRSAKML